MILLRTLNNRKTISPATSLEVRSDYSADALKRSYAWIRHVYSCVRRQSD